MANFGALAMAVAMLAAFALLFVGVRQSLRPEDRKRGVLMIVAAAVLIANVVILTI